MQPLTVASPGNKKSLSVQFTIKENLSALISFPIYWNSSYIVITLTLLLSESSTILLDCIDLFYIRYITRTYTYVFIGGFHAFLKRTLKIQCSFDSKSNYWIFKTFSLSFPYVIIIRKIIRGSQINQNQNYRRKSSSY